MNKVIIYTDGACSGNPGIGGWAAILNYGENQKIISGGKENTTNNEMEITAILEGLKALKYKCDVEVYSDSAYCVNTINKKWLDKWINNFWILSNGEQVKNKELWEQIYELLKKHNVEVIKVKGHSNVELNNKCDKIAKSEIIKIKKEKEC